MPLNKETKPKLNQSEHFQKNSVEISLKIAIPLTYLFLIL